MKFGIDRLLQEPVLRQLLQGQRVPVLDRPNPAGRPVEGLSLRPGWESFVGAGPFSFGRRP